MLILEFMMKIVLLGLGPLDMGPRLIGRRLPTWGVSSRSTMVGIPMQLQSAPPTYQLKMQLIVFFLI